MTHEKFWSAVGGRKMFNGYIMVVLLTIMVFVLEGTFDQYAMWIAASLIGTSVTMAAEDQKKRPPGSRRADDRRPSERIPSHGGITE